MQRRTPWHLVAAALLSGLLVSCSAQPSPTPKAGEPGPGAAEKKVPDVQLKVPESIPLAKPSPGPQTAASPAPAAKASPAARGESRGRVVYAWHTAFAPAWFDPQENPQLVTPYGWQYALHDALVKHLPGQVFAPSLAESYEIAPDFKSATFKLRPGIKFHNGDPVTPEDVKFTYENYRGAQAKLLKDKVDRIETPDDRTVQFFFKEPFLDFQVLYGSPASGAGWIVPKKYYQEVGPDGFKRNPIGAGPYKLVRQSGDTEFEFEAVADYWRKTPNVKTLVIRTIAEDSTRLAALQTGEVDVINFVPGPLVETVRADPKLTLAPVRASAIWLEFAGAERPDSPFNNPKVRQAASLALDRRAISQAEEAGLSGFEGNWIPEDWPGSLKRPEPEYNLQKAKQLLAEAGFPNGFEVEALSSNPPYHPLGERVITHLRELGIRMKLNPMERGAFIQKLSEGRGAFPNGLLLLLSASPGDAASRIRSYAVCNGSSSRTCIPEIEEKVTQYEKSTNPSERERLLREAQEYILDNYLFVPLYRQAFINAMGPRIANRWDEIIGAIPQYAYPGPYEDIQVRD